MPSEDRMTIDERFKYLRLMRRRYVHANRKGRGVLLTEMESVTGLHRKTLIRHMNGSLRRKPRGKQRGRTYGAKVDDAIRVISESLDHICAERLTPNLVCMAQHLAAHGEMRVSPQLLDQLGRISTSTVGRILQRIRQDEPRLVRRGSRRAHKLKREIPMRRIPWDQQEPGHFEVDLVHHCGPRSSGEYVHTLQLIDVATGWSELAAVLGRSALVMRDAFERVLRRLPFPVRELHPDNDSTFFNAHLLRFWKEAVKGVRLSRSRPYQKNDNRFVEHRNGDLVRAYLGHDRLDTAAQTRALNELYDRIWLYFNFFQPIMRLKEKRFVVAEDGTSRVQRRFDQARTPFERLCATGTLSSQTHNRLQSLRAQTNPRALRREIYQRIPRLFDLPNATPGFSEDVYETLATLQLSQEGEAVPVTLSFDRTAPL